MKLSQIYIDFDSLNYEEQTQFVRTYRAKRAGELVLLPPKLVRQKVSPAKLSEEDKALLRKFGITQRTLSNLEPDDDPDEGSFEFDDTYEINEEEGN